MQWRQYTRIAVARSSALKTVDMPRRNAILAPGYGGTNYWDTIGPGTLACKTKAHTTATQVEAGATTWWEHKGNKAADLRAKQGAALHPWSPAAQQALEDAWGEALEFATWAGWQEQAVSSTTPDAGEDISAEERAVRRQAAAARCSQAGTLEVSRECAEDFGAAAAAAELAAALA